jgi:hypothetical protein
MIKSKKITLRPMARFGGNYVIAYRAIWLVAASASVLAAAMVPAALHAQRAGAVEVRLRQ